MKKLKPLLILSLFLLIPLSARAQDSGIVICILEKQSGQLQSFGVAKSVLSGVLAEKGWTVLDYEDYPLSVSGEDLNAVAWTNKNVRDESGSSSFSARISPSGEIRLDKKSAQSSKGANLRKAHWRLDRDRVMSEAKTASARYVIYGEIDVKPIPKKYVPEGFAMSGYESAIAVANLRLVDARDNSVAATFTQQGSSLQFTTDAAASEAIANVARKAGELFASKLGASPQSK
jgi:hypothetical protein